MSAWTARDLLKAQGEGAYIRHKESGDDLLYRPRRRGDREPWVVKGGRVRYPSAECRPEARGGGPWAVARLLRIPMP